MLSHKFDFDPDPEMDPEPDPELSEKSDPDPEIIFLLRHTSEMNLRFSLNTRYIDFEAVSLPPFSLNRTVNNVRKAN